ncbi:MAG: glycosyltransferase family 2 protein, partial [Candidatus Promineifilaceae bacterium]|nr:glycosyltransferase family 2 protein [Candidatus Promineifilaceae bacterium]
MAFNVLLVSVGLLYFLISGALFVIGANFIYFSIRAWLEGRKKKALPPQPKEWPKVTVQLPIFNEMYVAERVIIAAAQLDYPSHLLQIQVLDDSTDETS